MHIDNIFVRVLQVFANSAGEYGNPVGIVEDLQRPIDREKRQSIALNSGFSEVVFINNLDECDVSIFSPKREIPFAGHALVGTAYYLTSVYQLSPSHLVSMGKKIPVWGENNLTWVSGEISILPKWNFEELDSPVFVDQIRLDQTQDREHTFIWAWIDKETGSIRARTFASDWGIPEDEANGSGSMKLAFDLQRELTIHHGKGSVIYAKPHNDIMASVGGRVVYE
jgi:predicted PhzF superfamily epimerase YddE/YHI9